MRMQALLGFALAVVASLVGGGLVLRGASVRTMASERPAARGSSGPATPRAAHVGTSSADARPSRARPTPRSERSTIAIDRLSGLPLAPSRVAGAGVLQEMLDAGLARPWVDHSAGLRIATPFGDPVARDVFPGSEICRVVRLTTFVPGDAVSPLLLDSYLSEGVRITTCEPRWRRGAPPSARRRWAKRMLADMLTANPGFAAQRVRRESTATGPATVVTIAGTNPHLGTEERVDLVFALQPRVLAMLEIVAPAWRWAEMAPIADAVVASIALRDPGAIDRNDVGR